MSAQGMNRQPQTKGTPNPNRRIHHVLECVAEGVVRETDFQRVIVTCYEDPLVPGQRSSESRISAVAFRGLTEEAEDAALSRVWSLRLARGDRYQEANRLGKSFFYPQGRDLSDPSAVIPSSRRYLNHNQWHQKDVLLIPFWSDVGILGHISVDDPRNGARLRTTRRLHLEEIASLATLALQDAASLEELTETNRFFQFLAHCDMTGLIVVQNDRIEYANEQLATLLGYAPDTLSALVPWWNFVHPDDRPHVWDQVREPTPTGQAIRAIRKDGRVIWLSASAHRVTHDDSDAVAFQFYDITDRIRTEELLKEKALRDPLTGFHHRGYFEDAIQIELQRSKRYGRAFTLMMADLAGFKQVNDRLGHQEGDRVLAGVASVLRLGLRNSDWIVRYGGDEFLLVLPETGSDVERLARRLETDVETWGKENVRGVPVGIDFGWATWRSDRPQGIDDLIREADENLYEQKRRRKPASAQPAMSSPEGRSNPSEPMP